MEKRTPHCKLAVVKTMLAAGKVRTTVSALAGGVYLKLTVVDDVLIVSFKEL
jgi:motility quorum-sensing regulator/GCU-specific mRNA interferase toxin